MDTELHERSVSLTAADGIIIPAIFAGISSGKTESALLLHGITTDKNEFGGFFKIVAEKLAQDGISSLRIDFRGHGDSSDATRRFTVTSQVLDSIAAKDWFVKQTRRRFHVLATSFGAPAAVFLAQMFPENIKSLSLISPVLDYRKTFLEPTTEWARAVFGPELTKEAFSRGFLQVADEFQVDVKLLVEMRLIEKVDLEGMATPILVIHGSADSMVPYDVSVSFAKRFSSMKFVSIPAMDHGYFDMNDDTGESPVSRRNLEQILQTVILHMRGSQ